MKLFASLAFMIVASLSPALMAVPIEVTYTDAAGTGFFDPTPRIAVGGNPGATLGDQRRIAFEFAARRWSNIISGTIPIKIRASFQETGPSGDPPLRPFLASARPQGYIANPPQGGPLPQNETVYPIALANLLVNQDIVNVGTTNDIVVECNSYYEIHGANEFDERRWYYGLDAKPPMGWSGSGNDPHFDFVVVALHEIGHGLGFVSHLAADGSFFFGNPTVWDRLMKMGDGTTLVTKTAAQRAAARTSDDVFIGSPNVVLYNSGSPAKVYAPTSFEQGSSMSHFDEATYSVAGSLNELMTPASSFGTQNLGPLALNSLRDMGYTMTDLQAPEVAITSPVPGRPYKSSALTVAGTARDRSAAGTTAAAGLQRVKIALSDSSARWYSWSGGGFTTTTFNHAAHTTPVSVSGIGTISTGEMAWSANLPAGLADGYYQLHVEAVDQLDQGSGYVVSSFHIDNSAPSTVIEPWANNDTVFDLTGLRVYSPDATSVGVKITRYNTPTSQVFYWSGTNWSTTDTTLPTVANGGRWSISVPLPSRADLPAGQPLAVIARATDAASNVTNAQINLTRTAPDTTVPGAVVLSPANGAVLTSPSLPALQGITADPESGIASVTVTLARFVPGGGVEFWSGTGWSASASNLPVIYDSYSGVWTAPAGWALPSGSSLRNGGYSVQLTSTNKESPAGTIGASSSFSVDYHPTYTWTGGTMRDSNPNNDSNSWGVPENWSPYGVPDVDDVAVIANGDQVTSTISRSVYGLKLLSGYLNFINGPGQFGTVTTSHSSEWGAATFYGSWVNGGSLLLSGGERWLWAGSTLTNGGTVTHQGGLISGRENCTITNLAGGTWISAASGDLFNNYYGGNQFINLGTFRQTATADSELNDWIFILGGLVEKQGAVLSIRTNSTLSPGVSFAGAGIVRILDGWITTSGTVSNSGGTLEMNGGTLAGAAPVTLSGPYSWIGGSWQGNLTLSAGSTLTIGGSPQLNPGTVFNNAGTVTWASDHPLIGRENVRVNNSGTWRLVGIGDAFANYYGGNVFNNVGLLEKTGSAAAQLAHWDYLLPGETRATEGILNLNTTISWPAGGLFSGAGTIQLLGGTYTIGGEVTSTVSTLRMINGTLNGAAGAKIQGNWIWSGGNVGGSLENPAGRTLTFDGWSQLNVGATLLNKGTVKWQGTSPLVGRENVAVTNAAGATWEVAANGAVFANYYFNNSFTNYGLLTRTAPSGEVHLNSWTYHQHGVFHATAGDTRIGSGLNLMNGCSFTGAGTFSLLDHTWLKGVTTFSANTLTYGAFHGEATGATQGTLQWASGSMDGVVNIGTGSTLRVTSPADHFAGAGGLVDCSGTLAWEEGSIQGRENVTIRIRSGASFAISSAAPMWNYYFNNHVVIDDGATLTKNSPGESIILWAFDNDGSASVASGLLSLHGGGVSDGNFSGTGNGRLRFAGGEQILETGASTIGGIEITGGAVLASGAAGGQIEVKGGTLGSSGTGVFSFASASTWTGGNFLGQVSLPAGASLATSGTDQKWLWVSTTLNVSGTLEWQGGHPIMGRESSTLDVKSGGIFRSTADGDLFGNYYGGNRLLVSGTFEKNGGSGNTYIDEWAVEGAGVIRPVTGKLEFNTNVSFNGGTQYQGAGKTRFSGSNLYVRGTSTISSGSTVELAGAWIHGHADGTATFQGGSVEWSGGTFNGLVTMNTTTEMTGGAEKWLWAGCELRNGGTMTLGGTGSLVGREHVRLVNLATGTMTCPGTATFHNYYFDNRLVNEGVLKIGAPVGLHTMLWTFQQTSTGTLAMEVGGSNSGTPEFDILQVNHPVELAGKLQITKLNGYLPADDTTFTILNGAPVTGTFTSVQAPGFGVEYSAGSVLLRAGDTGLAYEDWADDHSLTGPNRASDADPDRDGVQNLLEYAFNTDPTQRSAYPVNSSVMSISSQKWVVLKYRRWQDRIDAGLSYQGERSASLGAWNAVGLTDETDPDGAVIAGSEARRCRIPVGNGSSFLRLRLE